MQIMIVDDQQLMCEGLKTILESRPGHTVCLTAGNGLQALAQLENQPVDLVLMDIRMPVMDGVQAVREIKRKYPSIKVLMLTTFNDETYLCDALAAGADGYLLKDMDADALFRAIDGARQGDMVMPAQVAGKLRSSLSAVKSRRSLEENLKNRQFGPREIEIARLMLDGFTNSQIAAALFLSEGTARNYVSLIYEKLAVRDRPNALLALQALRDLQTAE